MLKFKAVDLSLGFDVCLLGGLLLLKIVTLFIKSFITGEVIVDASDLEYLNISKAISFLFIVPLIEEFAFRGILCLDKRVYVVLFAISLILLSNSFYENNIPTVVCVLLFSFLMIFSEGINNGVNKFIHTHLYVTIIVTSILFGLIHFTNYDEFECVNLIIVIPKILVGIFLSYITLKYNIFVAYIFHGVNNLMPFVVISLYSMKCY